MVFDEWDHTRIAWIKETTTGGISKKEKIIVIGGAVGLESKLHSDNFIGDTTCWWLKTKPIKTSISLLVSRPHPPFDPTPEMAEKYMARNCLTKC